MSTEFSMEYIASIYHKDMLPPTYQNTRRHNPEDHNTKPRSLKNFKSPVRDHPARQTHITDVLSASKCIQLSKTEKNQDKFITRR